jgi:hypothetical protein
LHREKLVNKSSSVNCKSDLIKLYRATRSYGNRRYSASGWFSSMSTTFQNTFSYLSCIFLSLPLCILRSGSNKAYRQANRISLKVNLFYFNRYFSDLSARTSSKSIDGLRLYSKVSSLRNELRIKSCRVVLSGRGTSMNT